MTEIIAGRITGRIEGDFVVFLIGMRINKFWKPHKWLPVLLAMPGMLKELEAAPPEVGFLGHNGLRGKPIVQYWRSFDHLERYARDRDARHWPAWVEFNRRMRTRAATLESGTRPTRCALASMKRSTAGCRLMDSAESACGQRSISTVIRPASGFRSEFR